jgi:benzoate-CoA ligase
MNAHGTPPPQRFNFAHDILERNVARDGKPAYIDDDGTLTYGELERRVRAAASALVALGLRR